jgi:hypothetical protein
MGVFAGTERQCTEDEHKHEDEHDSQTSEFGFKLNFHPLQTEITCKHNTRIARDGRAARSKFSQVPVTVQSEVKDSGA